MKKQYDEIQYIRPHLRDLLHKQKLEIKEVTKKYLNAYINKHIASDTATDTEMQSLNELLHCAQQDAYGVIVQYNSLHKSYTEAAIVDNVVTNLFLETTNTIIKEKGSTAEIYMLCSEAAKELKVLPAIYKNQIVDYYETQGLNTITIKLAEIEKLEEARENEGKKLQAHVETLNRLNLLRADLKQQHDQHLAGVQLKEQEAAAKSQAIQQKDEEARATHMKEANECVKKIVELEEAKLKEPEQQKELIHQIADLTALSQPYDAKSDAMRDALRQETEAQKASSALRSAQVGAELEQQQSELLFKFDNLVTASTPLIGQDNYDANLEDNIDSDTGNNSSWCNHCNIF